MAFPRYKITAGIQPFLRASCSTIVFGPFAGSPLPLSKWQDPFQERLKRLPSPHESPLARVLRTDLVHNGRVSPRQALCMQWRQQSVG